MLAPDVDHMTSWMPQLPAVNQTGISAISVVVCMHVCLTEGGCVCCSYVPAGGGMADGDDGVTVKVCLFEVRKASVLICV